MKIFIGCSSSNSIDKKYLDDCKALLDLILHENDLVFGACNNGIMGLAYNCALTNGRKITGICPETYKDDFKSLKCDKEITTKYVSERTKKLIDESDILLFLPGGIGTYFELFCAIESKRCHEFNKPIIIFNSNGFFNKFIEMMNQNFQNGFSKSSDKSNYIIANDIYDVVQAISSTVSDNNYKESYEKGLLLFRNSLREVNVPPYRAMLPYFEYPLSLIENKVEETVKNGIDTDDFYKEQCNELLKIYDRLLKTSLICKSEFGTKEEKRKAQEVINAIKEATKSSDVSITQTEQSSSITETTISTTNEGNKQNQEGIQRKLKRFFNHPNKKQ